MTNKPPICAADIPPEWSEMVAEIIHRNGQAIRAHATMPLIEVKSLRDNSWGVLMLHGSGTLFATAEDRDAVLRRIVG